MSKFKIKPTEAQEVMNLYYKLTGEKITTPDKLEQVHKTLQEYLKKSVKIHL
ncbi:hypothetical protein BH10ACI1_BH10ACI1_02610 [soil metagenome]